MTLSLGRYVQLCDELEQVIRKFDADVQSAPNCPTELEYADEIAMRAADDVCTRKGYNPLRLAVSREPKLAIDLKPT